MLQLKILPIPVHTSSLCHRYVDMFFVGFLKKNIKNVQEVPPIIFLRMLKITAEKISKQAVHYRNAFFLE